MPDLLSIGVVILLVVVAYLSLDIMGMFNWGNKFQVEGRVCICYIEVDIYGIHQSTC